MEMLILIGSLVVTSLLLSNLLATIYIGHARRYPRRQKLLLIALVWLLPLLGSLLFGYHLWLVKRGARLTREGEVVMICRGSPALGHAYEASQHANL